MKTPFRITEPGPALQAMQRFTPKLLRIAETGIRLTDLIEFAWSAGYQAGASPKPPEQTHDGADQRNYERGLKRQERRIKSNPLKRLC